MAGNILTQIIADSANRECQLSSFGTVGKLSYMIFQFCENWINKESQISEWKSHKNLKKYLQREYNINPIYLVFLKISY